ncbi:MAG: UxaA family hydrolase [Eisenbergiella sp.]
MLECDVFGEQPKPFGLLTEALDQLQENDLYCHRGSPQRSVGSFDGGRQNAGRIRPLCWTAGTGTPRYGTEFSRLQSGMRARIPASLALLSFRCPSRSARSRSWTECVTGDIDGVVVIPGYFSVLEKSVDLRRKLVRKAIESGMSATEARPFRHSVKEEPYGTDCFQIPQKQCGTALSPTPKRQAHRRRPDGFCALYRTDPKGHKIALKKIRQGELILKYGVPIGCAIRDIPPGTFVHLHCIRSLYHERSSHLDPATGAPLDTRYE